jgi:hypothetical protein
MDETYRMLGREREADLAREAAKFAGADVVRRTPWWRRSIASLLARATRRPVTATSGRPALPRTPRRRPNVLEDGRLVDADPFTFTETLTLSWRGGDD